MTGARRGRVLAAGLLALALAGCAADEQGTSADAGTGDAGTTTPAAFALDADFPDPSVLTTADGVVAFGTEGAGRNIQVATAASLDGDWTLEQYDALPELPAWATSGRTWAPEVVEAADGSYLMYFTAWHEESGRQCIGVATSPTVDGRFTATSDEPLVCPVDEGGAIDPAVFQDVDGQDYLLWKTDGNCCSLPTWIEIAPLSADGQTLAGATTQLLTQTLDWEGALVEAPVLVRHDDRYALFYSANDYGGDAYATGVAFADSLLGPYQKQAEPVLSTEGSAGRYLGPGGEDVVTGTDGDRIVFHSWDAQHVYRGVHVAELVWQDDGGVSVSG